MLYIGFERQVFRSIDADRQVEVRPALQSIVRVGIIDARPALGLPITIAADRRAPVLIEVDRTLGAEIGGPARRIGQFVAAEVGLETGPDVTFGIVRSRGRRGGTECVRKCGYRGWQ